MGMQTPDSFLAKGQRQHAARLHAAHVAKTLPRIVRNHICELYRTQTASGIARILMFEADIAVDLCDNTMDPDDVLENAEDEEEQLITESLMSEHGLTLELRKHADDIMQSCHALQCAIYKIIKSDLPPEERAKYKSAHMRNRTNAYQFSRAENLRGSLQAQISVAEKHISDESMRAGGRDWTSEQVGYFILLCRNPKYQTKMRLRQMEMAERMNARFPDANPTFDWDQCNKLTFKLRESLTVSSGRV